MVNIEYKSKRIKILYIVIILWFIFGILSSIYSVDWSQVSWYFASLTTYIGTYLVSESVKKSENPTNRIPKSKREKITYVCILAWLITGVYGILSKTDLSSLAAYFTSLSGFIILYVTGQHLRKPNTTQNKIEK